MKGMFYSLYILGSQFCHFPACVCAALLLETVHVSNSMSLSWSCRGVVDLMKGALTWLTFGRTC